MTVYDGTHKARKPIPWGRLRAGVERAGLAVTGLSGLVAAAWWTFGTGAGLAAVGIAALTLEWRFHKR